MNQYPIKQNVVRTGLLVSSLGLLALGCGAESTIKADRPSTVTEHSYDDPDTVIVLVGKVPVAMNQPEHFYITVEQCDRSGETGSDDRGCVTKELEVSADTYHSYPDGDQIVFAEDQ